MEQETRYQRWFRKLVRSGSKIGSKLQKLLVSKKVSRFHEIQFSNEVSSNFFRSMIVPRGCHKDPLMAVKEIGHVTLLTCFHIYTDGKIAHYLLVQMGHFCVWTIMWAHIESEMQNGPFSVVDRWAILLPSIRCHLKVTKIKNEKRMGHLDFAKNIPTCNVQNGPFRHRYTSLFISRFEPFWLPQT